MPTALAQPAYPNPKRPITLIIPYAAKSDSQKYGEVLAAHLPKYLPGAQIVLENRPGESGTKGVAQLMRQPPDGYALMMGRGGNIVIAPALDPTLPYRWNSFTFLGVLAIDPIVCSVRADSPIKTPRDLMDALRQAPGTLTYGHVGESSIQNMTSIYLMKLAGARPVFSKSGMSLSEAEFEV